MGWWWAQVFLIERITERTVYRRDRKSKKLKKDQGQALCRRPRDDQHGRPGWPRTPDDLRQVPLNN